MEDCELVVIVGAGIAGLATAVALKRVGVQSLVLEKQGNLRTTGAAITLFPNAWRALDALGVAHNLTSVYPVFDNFVDDGQRPDFVPLTSKEVYWFVVYKASFKGHQGTTDPEPIQREVLENMTKDLPQVFMDVVRHCDLASLTGRHWCFGIRGMCCLVPHVKELSPLLGMPCILQLLTWAKVAVWPWTRIGSSLMESRGVEQRKVKKALEGHVKERKWRAAWLTAGAYMSGWAQPAGSGWLETFIRDEIFYAFVFSRLVRASLYDSGALPSILSPGYKLD